MSAASTIGAILLSSLLLASPASASDGFDARVESSLQRLAAGDVAGAREAMESLVRSGTHPPLGALSVWLASGGVQAQDAHRWTEVDHPGEVRLQVIAAQRARQRGDLERAARHLALALALPLPDGLAISEARALGWEVADTPAGGLPGPDGVTSRGFTWALVLLAMLLGLLWSAWRSRDRRGLIVSALS